MKENEQFEDIIQILANLDDAPASNPLRKASARRAYLEHASRLRATSSTRSRGMAVRFIRPFMRLAIAGPLALFLAAGMLSGVAYAADGAKPGDLLYSIDQRVEQFRLGLASDTETSISLLLSFADERLAESEQLAQEGDDENLILALEAYGQTISQIAQTMNDTAGHDEALIELINQALFIHEQRLEAIRDQLPEQARAGLDRAINAAQNGHMEHQQDSDDASETQDKPAPDKGKPATPPSQDGEPKGPPEDPGQPDHPGPPEDPGPPDGQGPPENPGNGPPDNPGGGGGNGQGSNNQGGGNGQGSGNGQGGGNDD